MNDTLSLPLPHSHTPPHLTASPTEVIQTTPQTPLYTPWQFCGYAEALTVARGVPSTPPPLPSRVHVLANQWEIRGSVSNGSN